MTPTSLRDAISRIQQLPSLPGPLLELLLMLGKEKFDRSRVARLLEADPGLVVRLMRVANSSYYGVSGKVDKLSDAVSLIGYSSLRMIIAVDMAQAVRFPNLDVKTDMKPLLRHSLGVAVSASVLAQRCQLESSNLFLIGILHDVGRLAIASFYPEINADVRRLTADDDLFPHEAEMQLLGFTHAAIASALCEHWRLPASISQPIKHHHETGPIPELLAGARDASSSVAVLQIANAMAHGLNLDNDSDAKVQGFSDEAWRQVYPKQVFIDEDLAETHNRFESLISLLD